ncbi:MAG TPA: acetate--CoA ligase family protein [Streptosporangiaceae bacterium]|nr:acetate--CoA ligase family protein [Streptosporangiaceae bacterium]
MQHAPGAAALRDTLLRVSRLADDLPQVAELDLNPVIVRPDGVIAVDARIRVTSEHLADPFLRRLPSDLRQPAGPGQDPDHVTSRGAREPLVRSGSLNVPGPNGRASRSRSDRSPVSMASREEPACRERSRTRVGPR